VIRLHDVRRSSTTAALAAGERVEVVSRRLGHANVSVTMSIFAHVTAADDVESAERVAARIFGDR
jgi:integrase